MQLNTNTNRAFVALLIAGYDPNINSLYGGHLRIISVYVALPNDSNTPYYDSTTLYFEFSEDELTLVEWREDSNHYKYFSNRIEFALKAKHAPEIKNAIAVAVKELCE